MLAHKLQFSIAFSAFSAISSEAGGKKPD